MSEGEQRPIDSVPDPTAVSGNELGKSRATRRRILDAATACLAEQGYSRFSTGQVAARAGLTRPAMLYHFGSRQELLTAVMNHLTRRRIEMLDKALSNIAASEGHADRAYRSASLGVVWQ